MLEIQWKLKFKQKNINQGDKKKREREREKEPEKLFKFSQRCKVLIQNYIGDDGIFDRRVF